MRLYLDVCCLNRPYDDQQIDRNRLEAEAVIAILGRIRQGRHILISSAVIDREVSACSDLEKAELVRENLAMAREHVEVTDKELRRWRDLVESGFRELDALHLACAESARCELLMTTDDKLVKRAAVYAALLRVNVINPLRFVTEVEP
jgi:hypothetical protein